jgi:hypothetical protein
MTERARYHGASNDEGTEKRNFGPFREEVEMAFAIAGSGFMPFRDGMAFARRAAPGL